MAKELNKKKSKTAWVIVALAIAFVVFCVITVIIENSEVKLNDVTVNSSALPDAFVGYKIAHISDLHNDVFGESNDMLIELLSFASPDMIAITGDLIDSRNTDIDVALSFVNRACDIAPVYFVSGNHESRISRYPLLEQGLKNCGVTVLNDQVCTLSRGDATVSVLGIRDPGFDSNATDRDIVSQKVSELSGGDSNYKILLSHRPEMFDIYVDNGIDVVLCGHAHGGQFRIFGHGLFAPGQGWFPKYDSGLYSSFNTNMVVSRGIGNSLFPFRFNNSPEIVIITLKH